jgi:hypothetical protein
MARSRIACDVLVVGAGVAGIGAAIRASREGVHTLLIERNDHPGGAAVAGMHRFLCGLYANGDDIPDSTLNGGIAGEICDGLRALAPEKAVQRMGKVHVLPLAIRDLVSACRSLSEREEALEISYNTRAISAAMEGNSIASITVQNSMRVFDIVPSVVVDCSGDGIIVRMSGGGYQVTSADRRQLAGYAFRVTGLREFDELLPIRVPYHLTKEVNEERMPAYLKFTTYTPGDSSDEGYCRLNIPPTGKDRDEQARRDALLVHRHLSRVLSAFKGSSIAEMSPRVVDREGPRVRGEYTLTADDVLTGRRFSDAAVKNAWPIELWDPQTGPSLQYLDSNEHYEIPVRCLKPLGVLNCWCAGRCISATPEALASTRVMGTCISLGEEAGRLAAQSA